MRSGFLPTAFVLVACLLLPGFGSPAASDRSQADSLEKAGCRVVLDAQARYPRRVLVPPAASSLVRGQEPEHLAAEFLRRHAQALFGQSVTVDEGSSLEWRRDRSTQSRSGVHIWHKQHLRGIPVEGAWLHLQLDEDGRVRSLESHYRAGLEDLDLTATFSVESARDIARAALDREGPARTVERAQLVIDPTRRRLVWKLTEPLWSPFGDWQCLVDAESGELLETRNLMSHGKALGAAPRLSPPKLSSLARTTAQSSGLAQGSGMVLPANPLNDHPERYALRDGDAVDAYRESKVLERLDGSGDLRGDYVDAWVDYETQVHEPSLSFSYSADLVGSPFHAVNAYWHIDQLQEYLQSTLGITSANNRRTRIFVHAFGADNSVYSPVTDQIQFGDGGVDDAEDGEIVLHEYGHAIHENIVPDFLNLGESGAISEGFGDYVAASFGGNPLVGEWDATSYQPGPPPYLRRVDGEKQYPADLEHQVHADGEIISAVWWRLWNELGKQTTDALVVESFFFLGPDSDFEDFANAMLLVDQNLFAGAHVPQIYHAYDDRGIPVAYPLDISLTPLADTEDQDGPYPVQVEVAHLEDLAASDPVQLYWRYGGETAWTIVAMQPGAGDSWRAEIPGQGIPRDVEYAVTVIDVLGVRVWSPLGGPDQHYEFRVAGDDIAPEFTHLPLSDTPLQIWPPAVHAEARDASGIASVRVDWSRNGGLMGGFLLTPLGGDSYKGVFPLPALVMQVGDQIEYVVTAFDASLASNAFQSGPHNFSVVESLGSVLVLIDEGDTKAGEPKFGPDKQLLLGAPARKLASGSVLAEDLRQLGYTVDESSPGSSDPLGWSIYDLLAYACGGSTSPAMDADFRGDLRAWVSAGGKLLVEGGELGFDASSNPGYPDFASEVLHVDRWESDEVGQLVGAAAAAAHPLRLTPNPLPSNLEFQEGLLFGDRDSVVPDAGATLIYGYEETPANAGVLVYDDNTHPGSAQIVYWAFAYDSLLDPSSASQLAENSVTHLLAEEPTPTARLAGMVVLEDGGSAPGLEVRLTPSGITTLTDLTGFFELSPLHAGRYLLEVVGGEGYETVRVILDLADAEDRDDLLVMLRPVTSYGVCEENGDSIPDNDSVGLVRALDPAADGEVVGLKIQLEIEHPWRGDLQVDLTSPSGHTVVLHNRSGSDLDDLNLVYPDSALADGPGSLDEFLGEDAAGIWSLHIADLGAGDTGSFVRACLELVTADPIDVPVLASALRAIEEEESVRLHWEVSAGVDGSFQLLRSVDAGPWETRTVSPLLAQQGRMEFPDPILDLQAGTQLSYRLEWLSGDWAQQETLAELSLSIDRPMTRSFALEQNHPNPFNPNTIIRFRLPREGRASLRIYDLQGRMVSTLRDEVLSAGDHELVWDGTDDTGRGVAAGTYYFELRSEGRRQARPMVLLK